MRLLKFITLLSLLIAPALAFGQVAARVAGLEGNQEYMSLLRQEKSLQSSEDSLMSVISDTRKLYKDDAQNREKHGLTIVRLEDSLYELRNKIGIVVGAITAAEQRYFLKATAESQPNDYLGDESVPAKNPRSVDELMNEVVSQLDLAEYRAAHGRESVPPKLIVEYLNNYDKMKQSTEQYATLAEAEAIKTYNIFDSLKRANIVIDNEIASVWSNIYDTKVYVYTLLLDKMNENKLLSELEKQLVETNQQIAAGRGNVDSQTIFAYPLQKKLVLSYEAALAVVMADKKMHDSVTSTRSLIEKLSYDMPLLKIQRRNFINYEAVKFSSTAVYTASNPIPKNKVYDYGTVYRIHVGTFSRQQPVTTFRGASPVVCEIEPDGRWSYYAGAYRDVAEAIQGVSHMKSRGFRSPVLVVWRGGEFESLGDSALDSRYYRVEITRPANSADQPLKELFESGAAGKEISRSVAEDGKNIYIVGSFDSITEAQKLADAAQALGNHIEAKVVAVEI